MNKLIQVKDCPNFLCGIYKINFPNNKSYIGLSNDIKRRIIEHNTDTSQPVLFKAIQKYFNGSIPNFELLEEIEIEDRKLLQEREKYWINFYQTFSDKTKGYNLTPGGDGAAAGFYNSSANFDETTFNQIVELIQNTDIPLYQIANQFNCSRNCIFRINKGISYHSSRLNYPLRKEKYVVQNGVNNPNAILTLQSEKGLKEDLINSTLTFKELSKKYSISESVITNFNRGLSYYHKDWTYPLRQKNALVANKRIFSDEEMLLIKTWLEDPKYTMQWIANQIKCDRKVIGEINKGLRQPQKEWVYPIRKTR